MIKLTKRQQEILAFIKEHIKTTSSPPTRVEIAKVMGFRSPNAAEDHLRALARKGVIELVPGTSRGIRLKEPEGIPVIEFSHPFKTALKDAPLSTDRVPLSYNFFKPSIDCLLHIKTAEPSLNILPQDYLAVHFQTTADLGDIVIIRLHQEIKIMRYAAELKSLRPSIEGKVIGIIRSLSNPLLP